MTDLGVIELIYSDSHGNPNRWGGHWHYVRISRNPRMYPVAQMRDRGRFLNQDCFQADTHSLLVDAGRPVPPTTVLEAQAGNVGRGTDITPSGQRGLAVNGLHSDFQMGPFPLSGTLYVMNPAYGRVFSNWRDYVAASVGQRLIVSAPAVQVSRPIPQPPSVPVTTIPPGEPSMRFFADVKGNGNTLHVDAQGNFIHRYFEDKTQTWPEETLASGCDPHDQPDHAAFHGVDNIGVKRLSGPPVHLFFGADGWKPVTNA